MNLSWGFLLQRAQSNTGESNLSTNGMVTTAVLSKPVSDISWKEAKGKQGALRESQSPCPKQAQSFPTAWCAPRMPLENAKKGFAPSSCLPFPSVSSSSFRPGFLPESFPIFWTFISYTFMLFSPIIPPPIILLPSWILLANSYTSFKTHFHSLALPDPPKLSSAPGGLCTTLSSGLCAGDDGDKEGDEEGGGEKALSPSLTSPNALGPLLSASQALLRLILTTTL